MKTYSITPIGPILLNGNAEKYTDAADPRHTDMLAALLCQRHRNNVTYQKLQCRQLEAVPDRRDDDKLHNALLWSVRAPLCDLVDVARFSDAEMAKLFVEAANAGRARRVFGAFMTVDVYDGVSLAVTQVQPMDNGSGDPGIEGLYIVVTTDVEDVTKIPFTWQSSGTAPTIPDQLLAVGIRSLLQDLKLSPKGVSKEDADYGR